MPRGRNRTLSVILDEMVQYATTDFTGSPNAVWGASVEPIQTVDTSTFYGEPTRALSNLPDNFADPNRPRLATAAERITEANAILEARSRARQMRQEEMMRQMNPWMVSTATTGSATISASRRAGRTAREELARMTYAPGETVSVTDEQLRNLRYPMPEGAGTYAATEYLGYDIPGPIAETELILRKRQAGKTTKLLNMAGKYTGSVIIVPNPNMVRDMERLIRSKKFTTRVVTYNYYKANVQEFIRSKIFIDNVDILLQSLVSGPIYAMAMSLEDGIVLEKQVKDEEEGTEDE